MNQPLGCHFVISEYWTFFFKEISHYFNVAPLNMSASCEITFQL